MIRRTILEWGRLSYGDDPGDPRTIPARVAERIAAIADASPLTHTAGDVVELGRNDLRAKGVVGVIASAGCSLEILPKIDFAAESAERTAGNTRRRLVHMLAVALDVRVEAGQNTAVGWQRDTLLEILIRLFLKKLFDALRQGMPGDYIRHEDDLTALRGSLDVARQFTVLAVRSSRLACRFDARSPDTTINRIIKATISRLRRISSSAENQRLLRELAFVYDEIADVPVSALRWHEVVLDRGSARWSELLRMARLLLGQRFQTTSTGTIEGYSLLFEMNKLFEEYIGRMITRALAGNELRAVSQGGRLYCLKTDQGGLFQTKPDILIKEGSKVVQVIDTKWKRIASRTDDRKQGVSQADVYQMMAYGHLYDCPRLTLLYPHHLGLPGVDGLQAECQVMGRDQSLETATIDIAVGAGMIDRLRRLVGPGKHATEPGYATRLRYDEAS